MHSSNPDFPVAHNIREFYLFALMTTSLLCYILLKCHRSYDYDYDYDYEISLFGHRRKKNEHKGIINNKMVETTIKNINISKHDTKLISVVRLVIVIKCAPEISLVQVF